jgi:8-oxo-dGTP diphosphatase
VAKIEENETALDCLKRELKEEFSIEIEVYEFVGEPIFDYSEKKIKLIAFSARIIKGDIVLKDHDQVEWINLKDIYLYKMAPADIPLIELYDKKRNNK